MLVIVAHIPQQYLSIRAKRKKVLHRSKLYVDCVVAAWYSILPPNEFADDLAMKVIVDATSCNQVIILPRKVIQQNFS